MRVKVVKDIHAAVRTAATNRGANELHLKTLCCRLHYLL